MSFSNACITDTQRTERNKHQTKTTLHKLGTEENFNKIKDSYEKQTNKQKKNQS